MELTIANATITDNIYSWKVSYPKYKIKIITVVSLTKSLDAKYNNDVVQYLESGRPDDTCPSIFSGDFSVFFFNYLPSLIITDIQDINIVLEPIST
jgi:hypothetical protein